LAGRLEHCEYLCIGRWAGLSFYLSRAAFEAVLRNLGTAAGVPTAVVLMNAVEGGDQSGNMPYRAFFR